jgi:hypothetical protein
MGRPLKKDVLGTEVLASYATTSAGIKCEFFDTELRTDGALIRQRGAKTYVVTRVGDIDATQTEDSTNRSTCVLQSAEPSAAGQMRILGSTNGQLPATVAIAKLTKRIATDFSGNRYTWFLDNDSSGDVLVLTAI